jgi:hypothetical protein
MRRLLGLVAVIATLVVAPGQAGAASKPLPVPYDFLLSAIASGPNFTGNPPGANDWTCKPSAAHPC